MCHKYRTCSIHGTPAEINKNQQKRSINQHKSTQIYKKQQKTKKQQIIKILNRLIGGRTRREGSIIYIQFISLINHQQNNIYHLLDENRLILV